MKVDNKRDYIKDLIKKSNNILIVSGDRGNDSLAASIAFAIYIDDMFRKSSTVVHPFEFTDVNADLLGIYEVKEDLDTKTLNLVLDFNGTEIESVNYKLEEDNKLVLSISPVNRRFGKDRIKYDFTGKDYDLIITMGVTHLNDLGQFYNKYRKEFDETRIINIDTDSNNNNHGVVNIIDNKADSLCGLLFYKFGQWRYIPSSDASESLLLGMQQTD